MGRHQHHVVPSQGTLTATTLALDLGTRTGYAVGLQGTGTATLMHTALAGTWELLTDKEAMEQRKGGLERLGDARYYRLRDLVLNLCLTHKVTRIVFEDVKFSKSALPTQLWSSLRAALWEVKDRLALQLQTVPVPTLKAFACGNSHADKTEMELALRMREDQFGGTLVLGDDNETDARWLLAYTLAVDQGARSWSFGWQLQHECRIAANTRAAQRKKERKERLAAARADGLSRLDTLVRELGERMTAKAAHQAVTELGRSKRHTIKLNSHTIVGFALKSGELRWRAGRD
jgi:hypothetical protein